MGILDKVNERKDFLRRIREDDPKAYLAEISKLRGPLSIMADSARREAAGLEQRDDQAEQQLATQEQTRDSTVELGKIFKKSSKDLTAALEDMTRDLQKSLKELKYALGNGGGGSLLDLMNGPDGRGKAKPGRGKYVRAGGKAGRFASAGRAAGSGRALGTIAQGGSSLLARGGSMVSSVVDGGAALLGRGGAAVKGALGIGAKSIGSIGTVASKAAAPLAAVTTVMSVMDAQDKAAAAGKNRTGAGTNTALGTAATLGLGSLVGINTVGDIAETLGNIVTLGQAKSSMGSLRTSVDGGFDTVGEGIESFMTSSGMGDMIGRTMTAFAAPFSKDARDTLAADFKNNILPGFNEVFTKGISGFDESMGKIQDYGKALATGAGSIWSGVKAAAKTVVTGAGEAYDAAKAGYAKGGVVGAASGVKASVVTTGGKAIGQIREGTVQAFEGLGAVSHKYESGGAGVSSISTGRGDAGGVSYGTYQLSSKTGTAQEFVNSKEGSQFKSLQGLKPGSAEFNAAYKNIASGDQKKDFEAAQQAYIKRTHYDAAASKVAEATGVDLNTKGRGVQEALFSTSVQYGAGGAASKFKKVLGGLGKDASDEDIIKALQKDKMDNVEKNFRSSSEQVRDSARSRIAREEKDLLAVNAGGKGPAGATESKAVPKGVDKAVATAGAPTPSPANAEARKAPAMASVPKEPEQKTVIVAQTEQPKPTAQGAGGGTSSSGSSNLAPSLSDIPPFFPDLAMIPVLTGTV